MPSLLLHTCCAPCATYTVEYWRENGFEITPFWFNPNIHPFQEHQRRLETLKSFSQAINLPLIIFPDYEMVEFLRQVVGREWDRCRHCFYLRLSKTAGLAKEKGFNGFSTTLLISPYQKHNLLREIGERVAEEKGIKFLYADLRPGYHRSRVLSRNFALYRQNYCGCIYSEWERFGGASIPTPIHPLEEG